MKARQGVRVEGAGDNEGTSPGSGVQTARSEITRHSGLQGSHGNKRFKATRGRGEPADVQGAQGCKNSDREPGVKAF